ncbi:MAG: hypothetical protein HC926_01910 [Synechococcaceae cyanobacterium SM2_3_60]|nr:hypothetical protein [Synechococcaceae cyanobacterium SM2_3_60]
MMNVLRSRSVRKADFKHPASLLTALNTSFPMERHNEKYFTIGTVSLTAKLVNCAMAAPVIRPPFC